MNNLADFIKSLIGKNIHLIGVSGAEGSSILNLLVSSAIRSVTAHDFIESAMLEKNFKLWHKGIAVDKRNELFKSFIANLNKVKFNDAASYLKGITDAEIIFVPQSWRLYPQNKKLFALKSGRTSFYSLMRLYLDFAPARIVGVTGTVGKGSVANLIFEILKRNNKNVYFTGNETWRLQLAEKLTSMNTDDYLILEISHRQLQDGFNRSPHQLVFTNLYPNHLDEMPLADYLRYKLNVLRSQDHTAMSILNYDNDFLRNIAAELKSNVLFYSTENKEKNIISIQKNFTKLMSIKSDHYLENILAASTLVLNEGISVESVLDIIPSIPALPARLQYLGRINNVEIFDDIKSTTPWATLAAIDKFSGNLILIVGGDTKGISYDKLVGKMKSENLKCIALKSALSRHLHKNYPQLQLIEKDGLEESVKYALSIAKNGTGLLISPSAANFYSYFIRGKRSIRKIISAL